MSMNTTPAATPQRDRDDGCAAAATCGTCPLARCLSEIDGHLRAARAVGRALTVARLTDAGHSNRAIARELGIGRRSVRRIRQRSRRLLA